MSRIKSILPVTLIASILLILMATGTFAQGIKIGFVKDDLIQRNYKAWARAQEQIEVEFKAWDDEAVAKQQENQDLLDEYDKQKLILYEEKKQEKEATIRAKKEALDAFTRQIYGPGGTAENKQKNLLEPLLEKANLAIEAVALEGDFDVIFTLQSGLGYIKESYDVTDKVLEFLEKNSGEDSSLGAIFGILGGSVATGIVLSILCFLAGVIWIAFSSPRENRPLTVSLTQPLQGGEL